jgi:hypothetical protein
MGQRRDRDLISISFMGKEGDLMVQRKGVLKKMPNDEEKHAGSGPSIRNPEGAGSISPVDQTQLRTTEAQISPEVSPELPAFEKGCPQCGEIPIVTRYRMPPGDRKDIEIRVCYCRVCGWTGQLQRTVE